MYWLLPILYFYALEPFVLGTLSITAVGFYLSFPTTWDYMNSNSQLYLAMQEAIDSGDYNIADYNGLQGD